MMYIFSRSRLNKNIERTCEAMNYRRFIGSEHTERNSQTNQCARKQYGAIYGTNVCHDGLGGEFKSPSIIQSHTSRTPQPRAVLVFRCLPCCLIVSPDAHTNTDKKYERVRMDVEEKCPAYYSTCVCSRFPSTFVNLRMSALCALALCH